MLTGEDPQTYPEELTQWWGILDELRDVFDPHEVCAIFAKRTSHHLDCRSLVALVNENSETCNVWFTNPDSTLVEERWSTEKSGIGDLLSNQHVTQLEKLDQPAAETISSPLWIQIRERLIVIPAVHSAPPSLPLPKAAYLLLDPPRQFIHEHASMAKMGDLFRVLLDRAAIQLALQDQASSYTTILKAAQAFSEVQDVRHIPRILNGAIRQTFNVETIALGLVEPITGDIIFVDDISDPSSQPSLSTRIKFGQGITGWVVEHNEPVILNNPHFDKRFSHDTSLRHGYRVRSLICIPLKNKDNTIGVLQAVNRQSGEFSEYDLHLMQALGGPLAVAIENALSHSHLLAQALRQDELLDQIAEGVAIINRDGRIIQANKSLGIFLGGDHKLMVGSLLSDWLSSDDDRLDTLPARVFDSSSESILTTNLARADGHEIPVLIRSSTIVGESGQAEEAILAFQDTTQTDETELMRDDLFEVISRELRTPLATILLYSRLLQSDKGQHPDKSVRFLGIIERESDRLQQMMLQLQTIAKLDASEMLRGPALVEMGTIFGDLLPPLAQRAIDKGLLFRQRIASDLPPVVGNAEIIKLVLFNLLDNAIRFTPSGNVQITVQSEDGHVQIEVNDEGIGIPSRSIPHLFKPFYRTQTAIERGFAGTGLGLYMVKEALNNYNGSIDIQSTLGEGSLFVVRLPVARD